MSLFLAPRTDGERKKGSGSTFTIWTVTRHMKHFEFGGGLKNPAFEGITIVDSAEKRAQLE